MGGKQAERGGSQARSCGDDGGWGRFTGRRVTGGGAVEARSGVEVSCGEKVVGVKGRERK